MLKEVGGEGKLVQVLLVKLNKAPDAKNTASPSGEVATESTRHCSLGRPGPRYFKVQDERSRAARCCPPEMSRFPARPRHPESGPVAQDRSAIGCTLFERHFKKSSPCKLLVLSVNEEGRTLPLSHFHSLSTSSTLA